MEEAISNEWAQNRKIENHKGMLRKRKKNICQYFMEGLGHTLSTNKDD